MHQTNVRLAVQTSDNRRRVMPPTGVRRPGVTRRDMERNTGQDASRVTWRTFKFQNDPVKDR